MGYLEDYVGAVEKANKANGKEYEKVLKVGANHCMNRSVLSFCSDNPKPIEGGPPFRSELGWNRRLIREHETKHPGTS